MDATQRAGCRMPPSGAGCPTPGEVNSTPTLCRHAPAGGGRVPVAEGFGPQTAGALAPAPPSPAGSRRPERAPWKWREPQSRPCPPGLWGGVEWAAVPGAPSPGETDLQDRVTLSGPAPCPAPGLQWCPRHHTRATSSCGEIVTLGTCFIANGPGKGGCCLRLPPSLLSPARGGHRTGQGVRGGCARSLPESALRAMEFGKGMPGLGDAAPLPQGACPPQCARRPGSSLQPPGPGQRSRSLPR